MSHSNRNELWSAITLIAAPLLSVFAMTHHPSAEAASLASRLAEIVRESSLSAWVHGALIALMVLTLIAFSAVGTRLGWGSARVRAGAIAYSLGVLSMVGAAIVSGFIVGGLAEHYAEAAPDVMESARPALHLAHEANQALAKVGAVAMSAGIFLWSLVMLGRQGLLRGLGSFGLLIGLVPIFGLVFGSLHLDVHGMLLVVLAQALWTSGVGVWLLRARAT